MSPAVWPHKTLGWPIYYRDRDKFIRRLKAAGVSKGGLAEGLRRRGYDTLKQVVPELRDSVIAGIIDDWRNGRLAPLD